MIKIDESKLNCIKQRHWDWFWIRAQRKKYLLKLTGGRNWNLSYVAILQFFFNWDETDVKNLVLASTREIKKFTDKNSRFYKEFKANYDILKVNLINQNIINGKAEIDVILEKIFGYKDFLNGIVEPFENEHPDTFVFLKEWNAYSFTESLGIDVCPYCNRQYVFTLKKGNGRPEIDHYYPKIEYPYLSCSLTNFIPSCHLCNHQKNDDYNVHVLAGNTLKTDIYYVKNQSRTIYPYQESFDSLGVKFRLSLQNRKKKKVYFSFKYTKNSYEWKKIKNTIEAFHLREYYNLQQIEINDLLERYQHYAEPKIKNILDTIIYPSLIDDIEDLKKHLSLLNDINSYVEKFIGKIVESYIDSARNEILGLPMNRNDGKDYPFRKFKEDIIEQLETERKIIG